MTMNTDDDNDDDTDDDMMNYPHSKLLKKHTAGLVEGSGISIANTLEIPQSSTKLWIFVCTLLGHQSPGEQQEEGYFALMLMRHLWLDDHD